MAGLVAGGTAAEEDRFISVMADSGGIGQPPRSQLVSARAAAHPVPHLPQERGGLEQA